MPWRSPSSSQAPVVNSYLHNDSFPANHPLWCGPLGYQGSKAAMKLIAEADVVLALGTRLGPFGTLPQHGLDYWPKNAKIIQVDSDHRMLGLVKQISVGIVGDAKEAAKALSYRLANRKLAASANADERKKTIKAEKDAWEKELDGWTHEKDAWSLEVAKGSPYMHPRQMLRELEKAMPEERHGVDRHRQYLLGLQFLSALQPAEFDVRGDELRQLRLCAARHHRRQGGRARPAGGRLCRRRRLGHELSAKSSPACARTSR